MKITTTLLMTACGCTATAAIAWQPHIQAAFDRFKIDDVQVTAAILSNIGVESGGLRATVENLNYGAQGLADTWKGRYAVDPKAKVKVPNAKAISLARKPVEIANDAYANRMGNGSPASGDGWKFRGRGLIQLTGRERYTACSKAIGIDLIANPDALLEPAAAALSAVWFFVDRGIIPVAAAGNFSKVVEMVNGQPPCDSNHGPLRVSRYLAAKGYIESNS